MRHHTKDILLEVANTSYILYRTIGIGFRGYIPPGITISKYYLVMFFELLDPLRIVVIVAVGMSNRDMQNLSKIETGGQPVAD
jgi:hypothetical protein